MDFLNKLYESNYFGIGLFAVISFLVIMFLIVLFFGKKDEKKRKLDETNKLNINNEDAFKEVDNTVKLEVPNEALDVNNVEPVAPLNFEQTDVNEAKPINDVIENNIPTTPIANEEIKIQESVNNVEPVAPLNFEDVKSIINNGSIENPAVEPIMSNDNIPHMDMITGEPNVNEEKEVEPNNDIAPVTIENIDALNVEPVKIDTLGMDFNNASPSEEVKPFEPIVLNEVENKEEVKPEVNFMPNMDINNFQEPVITPIITEPTNYDFTLNEEPKTVEPTKLDVNFDLGNHEEPAIRPIIEEKEEPIKVDAPVIEEPVINDSYYQPVITEKPEEINIPKIDFDALAKSISDELDELEKRNEPQVKEEKPANDFKQIYVANSVKPGIELPKKIDLPNRKDE